MGSTTLVDPHGRTDPDRDELIRLRQAVNAEAYANWDDPQWRREMAATMTESIYWGFEHEQLLNLFATVENAPFDGRVFVKETRGLRAFWVARGGFIEASTLHAEVIELPRSTVGFHVYEMEDKLRTNFGETQSTLIDLGTKRMDAEVNRRVLSLYQAAIPFGSQYYVPTSGLTLTALNAGLRNVRDASLTQELTIIGRATMTEQIGDLLLGAGGAGANFLPETNEALIRQGVLGRYRNARIVTLLNYLDDVGQPFFPANELYIVARDSAKFAFWGGMLSKEYSEDNDWYWHYLTRRDFGGIVHRRDRVRRIVDNTQLP